MTDLRHDSANLDVLIADHRPGHSLERPFYLDPAIFEQEYVHLFSRQWQFADHISRIPRKGDYFLFRIAGEEIIVVRGDGDTVHAHFNVCRHRGSRVCLEPEGHARRFTCPYHAWTYRLDGSLARARGMAPDFDASKFSLRSCQVRVFEGLIFVNLTCEGAGGIPDFDSIADALRPWVEQADLRHTRIAHIESFRAPVNWKIALENYMECYHCPTAHPEWCQVQLHALRDAVGTPQAIETFEKRNAAWEKRARSLGHQAGSEGGNFGLPDAENYCAQGYFAERMLINDDDEVASLMRGGGTPKKLLGRYAADDGGQVDWGVSPSLGAYTGCTFSTLLRITPLAPLDTDLVLTWLVHEDAKEGIDYDVERTTEFGRIVMGQDQKITADTQAGVSSHSYVPGPYAELERAIPAFHHDYLRALSYGRSLGAARAR
ncbi:MAG: aromatic ring-hydroxylating dioxygenase subunit alpha [Acidobacteriota bacterium]